MDNEWIEVSFKINYKKEYVKYNKTIFGKKKMSLKEFAITILQIEPISSEIIAMYIGKQAFDVYNKNSLCEMMISKKKKNIVKGNLRLKCI